MTEQNKVNFREDNDGKEDLNIKINGKLIMHLPEDGYKSLGITYKQAKEFATTFAQLLVTISNSPAAGKESGE